MTSTIDIRALARDTDILEDAMTLWEIILELRDNADIDRIYTLHGTCEMRRIMAGLVADLRDAWAYAKSAGYEDGFDWQFTPAFVENCLDWSGETPVLRADWQAQVHTVIADANRQAA